MKFITQNLFRTALSAGLLTTATMVGCSGDDETALNKGDGDGTGGTLPGGDGDGSGGTANGDGDGDAAGGAAGDGDGDGDGMGGMGGETPVSEEPVVVPENICQSDKDCKSSDGVCAVERSICVDCLSDVDCGDDSLCQQNSCVDVVACESSKTCGDNEVCSTSLGYCVECEGNNDCSDGNICSDSVCEMSCASDKDCKESDQVCNMGAGICTDCLGDADCGDGDYCNEANECQAEDCAAEASFCTDGEVLTCNERGSGYSASSCEMGCNESGSACTGEDECPAGSEGCECGGDDKLSCDGSMVCEDGVCGDTGGGENCTDKSVDLCNQIPAFRGTQVMDGKGDEFCNIPSQMINFNNSDYNQIGTNGADTNSVEATLRMAWEPGIIRAHVHVRDPNVKHSGGDFHQGDNVQFFFSPEAPVAGSMWDNNAVQISIIPSSNSSFDNQRDRGDEANGTLNSISRIVSDGYEVEMSWTWADGMGPMMNNDNIGFNFQVGVLDSEDGATRDYEFALKLAGSEDEGCDKPHCDVAQWCSSRIAN